MANAWVTRFEEELMPSFQCIAEEIRQAHPDVMASVYSMAVGSATPWQGHGMGVECLFRDAPPEMVDLVSLCITWRT